ncbi:MAG: hypothetical protein KAW92_06250 [Candidatus Cloacimonetes bacterium]|nr:hypothetical protein [Candidatus Cloacimonadota bacterium]
MNNLLSPSYKHLLYKDKINDPFILTRYMEIFRKSKTILGVYCWNKKIYALVKKLGLTFNDWQTDDRLYVFDTKVENLLQLIELGAHKKRVFRRGKWLKNKEKRLGHKIYPYNPKLSNQLK